MSGKRTGRTTGISLGSLATGINTAVDEFCSGAAQADAENLDRQLRNQARAVAHSMNRFKPLIDEARTKEIHKALGFKSWTAYIADVIGKEMKQLPVDDRRQIVALLSGEGMSNRAIADAVGVNEITVRRDKDDPQVRHDVAPEPGPVDSDAESDALAQKLITDTTTTPKPAPVTGLDGKSYKPKPPQPQERSKPRRGPITDQASSLSWDLEKISKRLEKLVGDDRFNANREVIGNRLRPRVARALKVLNQLDEKINRGDSR